MGRTKKDAPMRRATSIPSSLDGNDYVNIPDKKAKLVKEAFSKTNCTARYITSSKRLSLDPSISNAISYLIDAGMAIQAGCLADPKSALEVGRTIIQAQQALLLEVKITELLNMKTPIKTLEAEDADKPLPPALKKLVQFKGESNDDKADKSETDKPSDKCNGESAVQG